MSKQTLLNQGGKWFDLGQLGAAPAAPAAGANRLYVDANGLLQFTSPAGGQPSRRITTDWGVGTAFPAAGLGRGDVYTHSGIGAMFLWNGASWRQATPIVAGNLAILTTTGTTYGALLHDGVQAYVTGIKNPYLWDTASSSWLPAGGLTAVTPALTATFTTYDAGPTDFQPLRIWTTGRTGFASGFIKTTATLTASDYTICTIPAGMTPTQQNRSAGLAMVGAGVMRLDAYSAAAAVNASTLRLSSTSTPAAGTLIVINAHWPLD